MKGYRVYKAVAAAFIIGSIVAACSSGGMTPSGPASSPQDGNTGRHAMDLSLTQPVATGSLIEALNFNVSGSTITFSDSNVKCGGSPDACALTAANASTWPTLNLSTSTSLTPGASTLNATCAPPGGSAGAGQCYIVALEGGGGPYEIAGPGTVSGGTISFDGSLTAFSVAQAGVNQPFTVVGSGGNSIPFVSNVLYNFFLEYVTASTTPAPSTPTPVPSPTFYPTPTPPPALCGRFGVLSTNPIYSNVHFEHTSVENGDVGMNGAAQSGFHLEAQAIINGAVHKAPGEMVQNNGGTITGGVISDPANVAAAVAAAESLSSSDAALSATQPVSSINIGNGGSQTINGTNGVNVLNLSSLEMGHATTLTLNAPAGSAFVINVAGEMKIGNTAQILLSGGITASNVTFNFPGNNGQVWVQYTSVVNGTILAPYRTNLHVDHTTTVNGAVIGDGAVMEFAWGDTVGATCVSAGSGAGGAQ